MYCMKPYKMIKRGIYSSTVHVIMNEPVVTAQHKERNYSEDKLYLNELRILTSN
jgi:hypothetical protein